MGIMADPDSSVGASFGHLGGGPGYSLSCVIIPDSAVGRLAVAVFAIQAMGPNRINWPAISSLTW
jgi:hypothetical protein